MFFFVSSRRKLFDKVDKDHDGFVNEKELLDWIVYIQFKDVMKNVEEEKQATDFNKDGFIEWDEFVKKTKEFIQKHSSNFCFVKNTLVFVVTFILFFFFFNP